MASQVFLLSPSAITLQLLAAASTWRTASQLAEDVGIAQSGAHSRVRRLVKRGLIEERPPNMATATGRGVGRIGRPAKQFRCSPAGARLVNAHRAGLETAARKSSRRARSK